MRVKNTWMTLVRVKNTWMTLVRLKNTWSALFAETILIPDAFFSFERCATPSFIGRYAFVRMQLDDTCRYFAWLDFCSVLHLRLFGMQIDDTCRYFAWLNFCSVLHPRLSRYASTFPRPLACQQFGQKNLTKNLTKKFAKNFWSKIVVKNFSTDRHCTDRHCTVSQSAWLQAYCFAVTHCTASPSAWLQSSTLAVTQWTKLLTTKFSQNFLTKIRGQKILSKFRDQIFWSNFLTKKFNQKL